MRCINAYSRQGVRSEQVSQMRFATSTPTPSLGKKVAGGSRRQLPRAIHSLSMYASVVMYFYGAEAKQVPSEEKNQARSVAPGYRRRLSTGNRLVPSCYADHA